jgi:Arylsulfotransferase (ASST)/Starch-binding associating with outer membrane
MRGFNYYLLAINFGKAIIRTEPVASTLDVAKEMSSAEDVWKQAESDLKTAIELLPQSRPASEIGRVTKGTAIAFLGKCYLFQKKYPEAKAELAKLMQSPYTYDLVENYEENFRDDTEFNKESIFELNYDEFGDESGRWNGGEGTDANMGNVLANFLGPDLPANGGWHKVQPSAALVDEFIAEERPAGSDSRWDEWDLAQILDSARYAITDMSLPGASFGQTQENWAHHNAIQYWGDEILASARFQGVFKIKKDKKLSWIISPHKSWRPEYAKYLLTPLDKNGNKITDLQVINGEKSNPDFDWPWGQHTPVIMPNGHILVFDNGYGRNFIMKPFTAPGQYSRIVEYEVNETNRTVRQVWEYGSKREDCYAAAMSSVQYLPATKHVLFCPGKRSGIRNGNLYELPSGDPPQSLPERNVK